jgi:hypothetical protein
MLKALSRSINQQLGTRACLISLEHLKEFSQPCVWMIAKTMPPARVADVSVRYQPQYSMQVIIQVLLNDAIGILMRWHDWGAWE